jgi:hypothetical protein
MIPSATKMSFSFESFAVFMDRSLHFGTVLQGLARSADALFLVFRHTSLHFARRPTNMLEQQCASGRSVTKTRAQRAIS